MANSFPCEPIQLLPKFRAITRNELLSLDNVKASIWEPMLRASSTGYLRVFSVILAKAWRKRMERVKELCNTIEQHKNDARECLEQSKNQEITFHKLVEENENLVYQLMVCEDKLKENEEIKLQLLTNTQEMEIEKNTLMEHFTTRFEDICKLEERAQCFQINLTEISDRFCILVDKLEKEKAKVEDLTLKEQRLTSEIFDLNANIETRKQFAHNLLKKLDESMLETMKLTEESQGRLCILKEITHRSNSHHENWNSVLRKKRATLREQVKILQDLVERSFEYRFYKRTINVLNYITFGLRLLLPAFPVCHLKNPDYCVFNCRNQFKCEMDINA